MALAPLRLAFDPERRRLPESATDEEHRYVLRQALDWQQAATHAVFWEMGAAVSEEDEGRVYALAGQMASAGEQLTLANAAGVEVALWREARSTASPDPEQEMCTRAMAEAQCLFVIGTGHALANVAVRALALDLTMRDELSTRLRPRGTTPAFAPFSRDRHDWVSMNADTCKAVRAVAQSSGVADVIALVEPVVAVGLSTNWAMLSERRGEDFHRWRPQTHGLQGVPRTTPWKRSGNTRVLSLGHPAYEEAQGLADETADAAATVMADLARAMEAFMNDWPRASGDLGGPTFQID